MAQCTILSHTFPTSAPGGSNRGWSVTYKAEGGTVENPRSGLLYLSGPGPIILGGEQWFPDPSGTSGMVLNTNVASLPDGVSRTDQWPEMTLPQPSGTITECGFIMGVGHIVEAEHMFYLHDTRNLYLELTGGGTSEQFNVLSVTTSPAAFKGGDSVSVAVVIGCNQVASKNVSVTATITDVNGLTVASANAMCSIQGSTTKSVIIPLTISTAAEEGTGEVCAYIVG